MIPFNYMGWFFKTFGSSIYPKSVQESLCDFLQPLPSDARVLDVGGGTGIMSEFAHNCRDDLEYIVVDPAQGMLKYTNKSYMKICKAHAETLPFEDKSVAIVLMGEALHHFRDVDKAIKETVRVLKKNGSLFIYDFDVSSFRGRTLCRIESILGEPANFFEPDALLVSLENYGFEVGYKRHGWRYTMHAQLKG